MLTNQSSRPLTRRLIEALGDVESMNYQAEIDRIEKAFEVGDTDLLRELLPPLLKKNVPQAIRINASFFPEGTPEEECDRIYSIPKF